MKLKEKEKITKKDERKERKKKWRKINSATVKGEKKNVDKKC